MSIDRPKDRPQVILGLSAYYHDAAACLLLDGQVAAAAHEERFTRVKHDPSFPARAARFVLDEAGLDLSSVDAVAFYDKPYLKFERLLETYHAFAPRGLRSFLSAIPVWIKEKLFMRRMLCEELAALGDGNPQILFPEHHLSHAASAYFASPWDRAAILTVDGVGEWATTTIGSGQGNELTILRELEFPHSVGLLYSAFTYWCGFKVNSGEYKLMGLAPYGDEGSERTARIEKAIRDELVDIRPDGSILLNMDYFDYATGLTMCRDEPMERLLGIARRAPESELGQEHMDTALAIQKVTEDIVAKLAATTRELTGENRLVMAGGVALNCVANGKLLRSRVFDDIYVQPAAGDAGGALGAALAAWHIHGGHPKQATQDGRDIMRGSYLGPQFTNADAERVARRHGAPYRRFEDFDDLCAEVAGLLDEQNVVGWFQGRMEWGPRALGNRSILGDPRHPDTQKKLNLKIKYREGFRPFAPSVLVEDAEEYFELHGAASPYMLLVAQVAQSRLKPLPEGYASLPMYERLYVQRSDIPAITHVDHSARIQTVDAATNLRYHRLISAFKARTGCAVVVNTSFNVRGEPIVCTPEDAYRCFMRTEMDYLVVQDCLFAKADQPDWAEQGDWRDEYELD